MTAKEAVLVAVGAAAVSAGIVYETVKDQSEGLVTVTLPQVVTVAAGTPTFVIGYDGGFVYMTNQTDAGTWGRLSAGGCVRRKTGGSAALCRMRDPSNPLDLVGSVVAELNRFPANLALPAVNDCQPVACAVFQGEVADHDEAQIVNELLGEIAP
jgi:hypothetical protein